jgi:hypothetical protein
VSPTPYSRRTPEQRERATLHKREQRRKAREARGLLPPQPRVMNEPSNTPRLPPLGAWVARASCAPEDVDPLWFDQPADRGLDAAALIDEQRLVALICRGCPVRTECLEEARRNKFTGIWGGVLRNHNHQRAGKFSEHDLIARYHHRTDAPKEKAA